MAKTDISNYVNKISASKDNTAVVNKIEEFFGAMNTGDKVGTSQLVAFLRDQGISLPEKAATDVPLQAAKRTPSVTSGLVAVEKLGDAKYSRIAFVKQ